MDRKMFAWRAADGSIDVSGGVWHFSAKRKKINRSGSSLSAVSKIQWWWRDRAKGIHLSFGHTVKVKQWHSGRDYFVTKDRSSGSPSLVQSTRSSGGWAAAGQATTPSIPVGRNVCLGIGRALAGSEHRTEKAVYFAITTAVRMNPAVSILWENTCSGAQKPGFDSFWEHSCFVAINFLWGCVLPQVLFLVFTAYWMCLKGYTGLQTTVKGWGDVVKGC